MHGLYLVWLVHERGFSPVPGHRYSLIIGSLVQVVAMLAFWRASTAPALLAAILLVALGDAIRSGAGEALLYRSCAALGRESEFQAIEALLVGGGAIVAVAGYAAAWISEIALSATGLVLALFMIEPDAPHPRDVRRPRSSERGDHWRTIVALITLSEAAGSWVSARVWRNDGRLHLLLLACGAAVFAASRVIPAGAAAAAVALAFLPGLIYPLRAAALQQVAGDGVRARIASLASACDMACSTLGLLAAGAISARRSRR